MSRQGLVYMRVQPKRRSKSLDNGCCNFLSELGE
jgi:hypothetical protein